MNYSLRIYCFFALVFFSSGAMHGAGPGEKCYFKSPKDDSRAAFRRDLVKQSREKRAAAEAQDGRRSRSIAQMRAEAQPDRRYSSIDYAGRAGAHTGEALPTVGVGSVIPKTRSAVWQPTLCGLVEEDAAMHNRREYRWEALVVEMLRNRVGADEKCAVKCDEA